MSLCKRLSADEVVPFLKANQVNTLFSSPEIINIDSCINYWHDRIVIYVCFSCAYCVKNILIYVSYAILDSLIIKSRKCHPIYSPTKHTLLGGALVADSATFLQLGHGPSSEARMDSWMPLLCRAEWPRCSGIGTGHIYFRTGIRCPSPFLCST